MPSNGSPGDERPFLSRPVGRIFMIWLLMTIVGVAISLYAPQHLMPPMMSTGGHTALLTIILFSVLAAPVAALVYAIAFYSLVAWRVRGDADEPPPDGPPIRGNGAMTSLWLVVSSFLVVVLLAWGLSEYAAETTSHPGALQVDVVGQQWLWTFEYPGTGIETRTLELPVNRPVEFHVTSVDVTHGFWPVSLGVQVDANPGVSTVIETTPDKLGNFVVRCSQLCGLYHSFMYAQGSVVSSAEFAKWLQSQGASAVAADQVAGVAST